MTLNFSRRPIFNTNPSEDNLVSSVRFSNGCYAVEDRNVDGFGIPQYFNWEIANPFIDRVRERADRGGGGGSCERSVTSDIDFLPSDPFGMGISATFTAITGWVEELETDRLDFVLNKAMKFQTEPGKLSFADKVNAGGGFGGCECWDGSPQDDGHVSICAAKVSSSFKNENENSCFASEQNNEEAEEEGSRCCVSGGDGGAPHDAMFFTLGYLGVQDLLSVEMVCKSLRSAVRNEAFLRRSIHIDQPLSERINDDALLQLTKRAQGNLRSLSLVGCLKISDDGLKRVLDCNPRLTKLNVAGCARLTVDGIINNLKAFKSNGASGIKHLRIGGRYGITINHFEELKSLVGAENFMQPASQKPQFYHYGYSSLSSDDERAIDIEVCPRCQNLTLVYDCPAESCQGKQAGSQLCRACVICIARCVECGRCINDNEYEETFCLDLLCSNCWKQFIQFQERQEERDSPSERASSSERAILQHGARYYVSLYG